MKFNNIDLDIVASTNDYAKSLIADGLTEPAVIIANVQTKGRGRGEHKWASLNPENIYSSYVFAVENDIKSIPVITLVAAIGAVRAINDALATAGRDYELKIKWPNDILLNGKKIVGILTEMAFIDDKNYCIIGVGINVDWDNEKIKASGLLYAGAINQILDVSLSRKELQKIVQERIGEVLDEYLTGGFSAFYGEYNDYLINIGKETIYELDNKKYTGKCEGVSIDGKLLIRRGDVTDAIGSGEVNVRGIYGH